jgi:hypothetical protein
VANAIELGLEPPETRRGASLRTWVRSLAGMQKEALVVSGATGRAWRMASDEGPYLAGYDAAPFPLSFMTAGMIASYMNGIRALARERGIELPGLRLTLDNYYTMEGSALQGTMTGGALPPELGVETEANVDGETIRRLAAEAVRTSPIDGLVRGIHGSLFTLTHNGTEISLGRVTALGRPSDFDPGDRFQRVEMSNAPVAGTLIEKLRSAAEVEGAGGVNTSLQEHQKRMLHVHGECTLRDDGVKEIVQNLLKPIGSDFRYLSDEAPDLGGRGLAPDAATYISAGVGFCFMTQLGRYAKIVKKPLNSYRIVQDTHFSAGGPGWADPVETHVYLDTTEDDDFARAALDMSEQTCFLHALCRTDLEPVIQILGQTS